MYKLRLKKKYRIILAIIGACLIFLLLFYAIENYKNYLRKCDTDKGYTCNIFGR